MKRTLLSAICALALTGAGKLQAAPKPDAGKMGRLIETTLSSAMEQYRRLYEVMLPIEGRQPDSSDSEGRLVTVAPADWTSGFFPGTLWYLYEYSRDPEMLEMARTMTARQNGQQYNTSNHDVGFMINCSYGNGYRLTGEESYRQVIINTAASLGTRFNPAVGCTRSWDSKLMDDWDFVVIVDNMMNLELLTVASALSGDLTAYNMAKTHAFTTMRNHFRDDYSSYHVVNYNSADGSVISRVTHQGYSNDSAWARGQAWGLYGYTMMYRQTGEKAFLDQAENIGRFIMTHPNLPKDGVPYWDFSVKPGKNVPRDASAAAIMASAYIELSTYVEDPALAQKFLRLAEKMLASLSSPAYRARTGENNNFILMHSTSFFNKGIYDKPLSYADYYFVEALLRYRRLIDGRPAVDNTTVASENPDRQLWLGSLDRVVRPVLSNLAAGTLRANMPVESTNRDLAGRAECTHLEALGRIVTGIAPWLELGAGQTPEGRLRAEYISLTCKAIAQAVDPESPDYLNFNKGQQPLVDAAFLAHGILRAPRQIWGNLDPVTRSRLVSEMKSTRVITPGQSNWLLFSAMVEAFLKEFTGECETGPVEYAIGRHKEWYKGDGWYGDGPNFHFDYYNSFVIQPMMVQVLQTMEKHGIPGAELLDTELIRYARFAQLQERMISPEGTYPVVGRSLAYRFGSFQALSDAAYRHILPEGIDPAQVRCAISAVIRRQIGAPGTFNDCGWLRPGICGYQPHIGEDYISTGSLYLCCAAFIALGLPADDPFWARPAAPWTCLKAFSGEDLDIDRYISN